MGYFALLSRISSIISSISSPPSIYEVLAVVAAALHLIHGEIVRAGAIPAFQTFGAKRDEVPFRPP